MASRTIQTQSRRYSTQLIDALTSVLALELLAPSRTIYLFSGWVTDTPILDNSFGQYRPLLPESTGTTLHLSTILVALAERDTEIRMAVRDDDINRRFVDLVQHYNVRIKLSPNLHIKMLVSEHFCWEGSMNFTYSGIHRNPEAIILTTDKTRVSKAWLDAERTWESLS